MHLDCHLRQRSSYTGSGLGGVHLSRRSARSGSLFCHNRFVTKGAKGFLLQYVYPGRFVSPVFLRHCFRTTVYLPCSDRKRHKNTYRRYLVDSTPPISLSSNVSVEPVPRRSDIRVLTLPSCNSSLPIYCMMTSAPVFGRSHYTQNFLTRFGPTLKLEIGRVPFYTPFFYGTASNWIVVSFGVRTQHSPPVNTAPVPSSAGAPP